MRRTLNALAIALLGCGAIHAPQLAHAANTSKAEQVLASAAAEQQYTFLVFYRQNDAATKAMVDDVKRALQAHSDATVTFVKVTDPSNQAIVARFGTSRAPMPLTVAVAPNGATTKVIPTKVTTEQIEEAFVTPVMAQCIKSMQEGKLVFICIQSGDKTVIPVGVRAFTSDAEFKERSVIIPVHSSDPEEAELVRQLEEDVARPGATTVLLAPPGVLVGKFAPTTTMQQIAAELHKAGQCCDDPHCKHNHGAKPSGKPASGAARPTSPSRTRR